MDATENTSTDVASPYPSAVVRVHTVETATSSSKTCLSAVFTAPDRAYGPLSASLQSKKSSPPVYTHTDTGIYGTCHLCSSSAPIIRARPSPAAREPADDPPGNLSLPLRPAPCADGESALAAVRMYLVADLDRDRVSTHGHG